MSFEHFDFSERSITDDLLASIPKDVGQQIPMLVTVDQLATTFAPYLTRDRWERVLDSYVGKSFNETSNMTTNIRILLLNKDFLQTLNRLVQNVYNESWVHLYTGWLAVQLVAPLLSKHIAEHIYGSWSAALSARTLYCLSIVERRLGWAVLAAAELEFASSEVRQGIRDIVFGIRNVTRRLLREQPSTTSSWPTAVTDENLTEIFWLESRFPSMEALDAMYSNYADMGPHIFTNWENSVGGVSGYATVPTTPLYYLSGLSEAPFFDVLWNNTDRIPHSPSLVVKPHNMVFPMYSQNATAGLNYGTLGAQMAWGLLEDVADNRSQLESLASNCDRQQMSRPRETAVFARLAASQRILFTAFRESAGDSDVRLPDLRDYSETAIFFLVGCFLRCDDDTALDSEAECNEPLKRNPHFAETFHCAMGATMSSNLSCASSF